MGAIILAILMVSGLGALAQSARPADSKDAGDKPQRTVHAASATTAPAQGSDDRGRGANPHALDSLSSSTDDLNAIRDSNLRKLTKDGCSPEISGRMAEVKGRLRAAEAELQGVEPPPPASADKAAPSAPQGSAQAIATDWFKPADPASTTAKSRESQSKDLVGSVLPGVAARTVTHPKAPLTAEKRQVLEQDLAVFKAEIEHLSVACPGVKP